MKNKKGLEFKILVEILIALLVLLFVLFYYKGIRQTIIDLINAVFK